MTTDPVEPREPREPREARKPADPFERAARREEQEELRRELTRATLLSSVSKMGKDSEASTGLVVLGIPYLVWALIRASYYDFGEPTLPQSIVRFLFDDFWWFGAYSVLVLIMIWATAITRFSGDDD